jgi:ATP-dependent DNA helicase RecG
MFEVSDKQLLSKLKVSNILDLTLIVPSAYENNYLTSSIVYDNINNINITVKSTQKNPKFLKILAECNSCNQTIEILFFSYTSYHVKSFFQGAKLYIKGRLQRKFSLTMIQPKIIKNIDTIEIKYKTPLQNALISRIIKKYITLKNLEQLPQNIAQSIYNIHNPTLDFVLEYQKNSSFNKNSIYALKYTELLNYLTTLHSKKTEYSSKTRLNSGIDKFISSLPFNLTHDQLDTLDDIKIDLDSNISAKRVIMGDVGSGKTILILASAMIAYPHKSILMAPTTILANQIYSEAIKYLPSSMKITIVTNHSKKEDLNQYDFVIGTHALLYRELPHFELLMIDEQHRFGTKQRQALQLLGATKAKRPHFLQFTATPIPRTMAMIESSFVKFSFLRQTPFVKDIDTKIIHKEDFTDLIEHIKTQISKNHQTIIVYPLVKQSQSINYQSLIEAREYWESNFDKVYITHGKDKEKEHILEEFKNSGNILLSTTVIEVGISLPKLTTIVIVGAERLGLASLHQLRGRVSRNGLKGYCYLFSKTNNSKRLDDFSRTTNGFEIAELDLKYREGGDLLSGDYQSGKQFSWIDLSSDEEIINKVKLYISSKAYLGLY